MSRGIVLASFSALFRVFLRVSFFECLPNGLLDDFLMQRVRKWNSPRGCGHAIRPCLCMFRKGRPVLPWLHFGLHFGLVLGAKRGHYTNYLASLAQEKPLKIKGRVALGTIPSHMGGHPLSGSALGSLRS